MNFTTAWLTTNRTCNNNCTWCYAQNALKRSIVILASSLDLWETRFSHGTLYILHHSSRLLFYWKFYGTYTFTPFHITIK